MMFRRLFLKAPAALALAGGTGCVTAQQRRGSQASAAELSEAKDPQEARILAVIREMSEQGGTYLSVPIVDGKWLRILAQASNAKTVVEVGTSTGFSGLFFALALTRTGGKLITHDIDQGRADRAKANFAKAGVSALVTQVVGDARQTLKALKGPIDVVFLDADKEGYVSYLDQLLPMVRSGGLILAHNTPMIPEYLAKVRANPGLETVIYSEGGGLSVSVVK